MGLKIQGKPAIVMSDRLGVNRCMGLKGWGVHHGVRVPWVEVRVKASSSPSVKSAAMWERACNVKVRVTVRNLRLEGRVRG